MKTLRFRIYYKDYRILRKLVPGEKGETAANYFSKVIKKLSSITESPFIDNALNDIQASEITEPGIYYEKKRQNNR